MPEGERPGFTGAPPEEAQLSDTALIDRLLQVVERDILLKTRAGVAAGNKIFGAAILRKSDLSLVVAESNNEIENPLWHGEVHALKAFYELPSAGRPATRDCLFLATHEPCSLCLSAITWSGFDNFYHLFSHEESRDAFDIPHDLRILKEVFRLEPGGYARENAYWSARSLAELIADCDDDTRAGFDDRVAALTRTYAELSEAYQDGKAENDIPLG